MDNSITIDKILAQIQKLDFNARVVLMERLNKLLENENKKLEGANDIRELNGLGSEIWSSIDIDNYIQKERQWD